MLLGIDGGGTKTDVLLTDNDGTILARHTGAGSNLSDSGLPAVRAHLMEVFSALPDGPIEAVYAGVAGCGLAENSRIMRDCLVELLPQAAQVTVSSDILNAYYAVDGVRDGICIVAGTGASGGAVVAGKIHQVSGWGHLIDDAGSGFDIGRRVLCTALRAHDGRAPETALTQLVAQALKMPAHEAIPMLYREGRQKIASLAPLAFSAMDSDAAARDIVKCAAEELCAIVRASARHLPDPPYFTVLCGGLWRAEAFRREVIALLGPEFEMHIPTLPPVFGCAVAAGQTVGKSILVRLKEALK